MKQYIFYTLEGFTQSPLGHPLENMQILGFASGKNEKEAQKSLLNQNEWIVTSGFNENSIECRQLIDL